MAYKQLQKTLGPILYNYFEKNRGKYERYTDDVNTLVEKLIEGMAAENEKKEPLKVAKRQVVPQSKEVSLEEKIEKHLGAELYEYYCNHREVYAEYTSNLSLLHANIFKDMIEKREFPVKERKPYHYEIERKCIKWLNQKYGQGHTFDNFRKIFKDILKNYRFKSDEYYEQCDRIVKNNMEFDSQNESTVEKNVTKVIIPKRDDKYDYKIETERSYGGYTRINYIVTKNRRESLLFFDSKSNTKENFIAMVENSSKETFDEFCKKYYPYLFGLKKFSKDFKRQCLAIILENEHQAKLDAYAPPVYSEAKLESIRNFLRYDLHYTPQNRAININRFVVIKHIDNKSIPFVRIDGMLTMAPSEHTVEEECRIWAEENLGKESTFKAFCDYFCIELSQYEEHSSKWWLVCHLLCLGVKTNNKLAELQPKTTPTNSVITIEEPINIDNQVTFIQKRGRSVISLKVGDETIVPISDSAIKDMCDKYALQHFGIGHDFRDFCYHFSTELSVYRKWCDEWKLVCQALCKFATTDKNGVTVGENPVIYDYDENIGVDYIINNSYYKNIFKTLPKKYQEKICGKYFLMFFYAIGVSVFWIPIAFVLKYPIYWIVCYASVLFNFILLLFSDHNPEIYRCITDDVDVFGTWIFFIVLVIGWIIFLSCINFKLSRFFYCLFVVFKK